MPTQPSVPIANGARIHSPLPTDRPSAMRLGPITSVIVSLSAILGAPNASSGVGRSSRLSGGPTPSSYAPCSIGVVLAAGFPADDSTAPPCYSVPLGVLPALRRPGTAGFGTLRDVSAERPTSAGTATQGSGQWFHARLPVVVHEEHPGALGHRRHDLAGESQHRGLVGRAVPDDERAPAFGQLVEHPPERCGEDRRILLH